MDKTTNTHLDSICSCEILFAASLTTSFPFSESTDTDPVYLFCPQKEKQQQNNIDDNNTDNNSSETRIKKSNPWVWDLLVLETTKSTVLGRRLKTLGIFLPMPIYKSQKKGTKKHNFTVQSSITMHGRGKTKYTHNMVILVL